MPILIIVRLLQSSSEIFCPVVAKLLFEFAIAREFSDVSASERRFKWLMSRQRIQEGEEAWQVRVGKKTHESLGFVIESLDAIGRRISHGEERWKRNQVWRRDGRGVRLSDVTASALVAGVRCFRDVLRKSFVEPTGNAARIESVHDEMNNFVPEKIAGEFVGRIALNEKAARGMNATAPRLQFAEDLKLLPFFRALKNVNVRLDVASRLIPFQLFGNNAIMELRFY